MINTFAKSDHLKENWDFFLSYLKFKKAELGLFNVDTNYLKEGTEVQVTNNFLCRMSHRASTLGSRYLATEEQIWEAIFATKMLILEGMMKDGDLIADIGSENSFLPLYLAFARPVTVMGLDLCIGDYGEWFKTHILNNTRNGIFHLTSKAMKERSGQVFYRQADATNMPEIKDNTFNIITCISTIEHIQEDTKAIKEMSRVLADGGKILFTFPMDKEYNQERDAPDDVSWDIDRKYSPDSLIERLIEPTGLKIYDKFNYEFSGNIYRFVYRERKEYHLGSLILEK